MQWIYNLLINIYSCLMLFIAKFHPKAKLFIDGRKNWRQLQAQIKKEKFKQKKVIWIHCASLGEFEQGKPILVALKHKFQDAGILVSFYSPSGYEYQKNYSGADAVVYLPTDTRLNTKDFLEIWQPELALFVKYEFWHNYLHALQLNNIPIIYFSVLFQKRHIYFKWYGSFFRKMLYKIDHFFVQNEASAQLLDSIGITEYTIAGDTRFDSAWANTEHHYENEAITSFIHNQKVLLAGSTWHQDDAFLIDALRQLPKELKLIIAPHDIQDERIQNVLQTTKGYPTIRLSQINTMQDVASYRILIIDNIGVLKYLYRMANAVWIGGGFNKGIHNTVEAAVYGKPILFGREYKRFQEAIDLLEINGAVSFELGDQEKFDALIRNEKALSQMGDNAYQYALMQKGATKKIMDYVVVKYLSTNA